MAEKTENPKSVRWTDETHNRTKELAKSQGLSVEDFQKQLLALHDRVSLESDQEFGPQISIVNELLIKLGEKFNSMVGHAHDKLEIQEKKYNDHLQLLTDKIEDYKNKVRGFEDQFNGFEDRAVQAEENAASALETLNELKITSEQMINNSNGSLADKEKIISDNEEKIKGKNEDIDELNKQIKDMKDKIEKYDEIVDEKKILEQTIIKSKTDIDELKKKYADELKTKELEKREAVLSVKEELNNEFNGQLRKEIQAREEFRNKFEDELATIRKEYEDKLTQKDNEIKSITSKNTVLEDQVQELKNKDKK